MNKEDQRTALENGVWIAETSHDLKTYLNPIVGFASVLVQDRERLQEDQLRQVNLIYESARKLLDRIDALVMLLKLRGGAWKRSEGRVDGSRLLVDVAEHLREWAKKKKIELVLEPAEGLQFPSDITLLSQALRELAGYRMEHLDGGWLRLSCRSEGGEGSAAAAVISLNDSGSPPSSRESQRWRTFLESAEEASYTQKGIGLWLALAREAVSRAGGKLALAENGAWEIRLPRG